MNREATLVIYNEIVTLAGLERKGKTMPYTSSNGYMFSQLNKDGEIGIRLSKEDTALFDSNYGAQPFKSYGATMREYVLILEKLLTEKALLANLLKKGYDYVNGLPPK